MVETEVGTPDQSKPKLQPGQGKQPDQKRKPGKPMDKPKQAKNPVKLPKGLPRTLAPPTMKEANDRSTNKPVTNESLVAESAFVVDSGFVSRNREIGFHPSLTGWTSVIEDAYAELRNDGKIQVSKELPIEAFRYYGASMFWLRTTSLKLWLGHELTPAEVDLQRTFEGKTFVLPDFIHIGLKAIGKTTTKNGEVLAPLFPDVPVTITEQIPGTVGRVDADNHHIYEDYPVVGITYQGCVERAARSTAHVYNSVVAPPGTNVTRNLQGFDSLKTVRQDCLAVLEDMGFGDGRQPRTVANTGINYNALKVVSNVLAKTDTFKIAEVDVFSIPATGSLAQIIETVPTDEAVDTETRASTLEVTAQSYADGTTTQIGISEVYGLNAWKGSTATHPWQSWSSVTWTDVQPPPARFVEDRNLHRDLPARFQDRVFYTGSVNLQDQRKMVVSRLARHPS